LLPDFEDAGYQVLITSSREDVVYPCGGRSGQLEVDLPLSEVNVTDYDAIVYIGGYGCRSQWGEEDALQIARDAVAQEVVLGAIGCGPTILAHAGVLEGVQATVCTTDAGVKQGQDYTVLMEELGAIYVNQIIVRDGLIITSRPRSWLFVPGILETITAQDS
jgi:protease I